MAIFILLGFFSILGVLTLCLFPVWLPALRSANKRAITAQSDGISHADIMEEYSAPITVSTLREGYQHAFAAACDLLDASTRAKMLGATFKMIFDLTSPQSNLNAYDAADLRSIMNDFLPRAIGTYEQASRNPMMDNTSRNAARREAQAQITLIDERLNLMQENARKQVLDEAAVQRRFLEDKFGVSSSKELTI